jgi:hypothetical protein
MFLLNSKSVLRHTILLIREKYYYIVGERQSIYIPLRPYLNMPSVLYKKLKDNHYDKDVTRPT